MIDLKKFRNINITERKILDDFVLQYAPKLRLILKEVELQLYISLNDSNLINKYPTIYLISNGLIKALNIIGSDNKISSSGLYFGFIKKNKFYLSIEGAEFLYNKKCFSKHHYVKVNDRGERSILYGNNIKKDMIIIISNKLRKNDILFVINSSIELLAIAQSQVDYNQYHTLKKNDLIALNLIDKGYYLRIKQ